MERFTFAHMADCHIGSWRDPKLKDISLDAFIKSIDICLERKVDFILISGDLFNTSLPSIDNLKATVKKLKQVHKADIPVYIIAGSHDFSPSGKTMLDVLEEAGLVKNVFQGDVADEKLHLRFTQDPKTKVKITGILGKKGTLERSYYEDLFRTPLESEPGYKIFMLHTALTELKPSDLGDMDSAPISFLPKNFNYYAAGHVHIVKEHHDEDYKDVVYPGPLFPNNFSELEKLGKGGFYIVDVSKNPSSSADSYTNSLEFVPVIVHPVLSFDVDCNDLLPEQVEKKILAAIEKKDLRRHIVTLRLHGTLSSQKPSDIDFKKIYSNIYSKGAFFTMKNTYKLESKEFEDMAVQSSSQEEIEDAVIDKHSKEFNFTHNRFSDQHELIKDLIDILSVEKLEGEKNPDFETRLKTELDQFLLNNK